MPNNACEGIWLQKFLILDSTLREGEQGAGISFSNSQRLELAQALSEAGVNFIEISPIVSQEVFEAARELCGMGLRANVVAHCRAMESDIDLGASTGAKWVALFHSTSEVHLREKLHKTREQALEDVRRTVSYAHSLGLKTRFTCEDASRTELGFLKRVCLTAEEAGADRISITDTVGAMTPNGMKVLVSEVKSVLNSSELDAHCHDDCGLALANSMAALEGGATCVHCTIDGIGERTGIAALAEVVMSSRLYEFDSGFDTTALTKLSERLREFTEVSLNSFQPVVGENAFSHKGGTHHASVLRNASAYESFSPEEVGNKRRIVLGHYSGKGVLNFLNEELGMRLSDERVQRQLQRLKEKGFDALQFEI
jgi:2-isopropylmalate synthase